jgi:hypothetical protein
MEKIPSPENNKKEDLQNLLKSYPIPEQFNDKAELALNIKKIMSTALERDTKNYDKIRDFALRLRNTYKNTSKYYLFNILIGSTGMKSTEFDFPGEDSIEKFLKLLDLSSRLDD